MSSSQNVDGRQTNLSITGRIFRHRSSKTSGSLTLSSPHPLHRHTSRDFAMLQNVGSLLASILQSKRISPTLSLRRSYWNVSISMQTTVSQSPPHQLVQAITAKQEPSASLAILLQRGEYLLFESRPALLPLHAKSVVALLYQSSHLVWTCLLAIQHLQYDNSDESPQTDSEI